MGLVTQEDGDGHIIVRRQEDESRKGNFNLFIPGENCCLKWHTLHWNIWQAFMSPTLSRAHSLWVQSSSDITRYLKPSCGLGLDNLTKGDTGHPGRRSTWLPGERTGSTQLRGSLVLPFQRPPLPSHPAPPLIPGDHRSPFLWFCHFKDVM